MTLESATAALTKIMGVDMTIVKFKGGDYVPVGNLRYVVMLAREALGLPRVPGEAMKKRPTIAEMRRTLELIAGYVLPVYTVNEREMVPVANAEALRGFARAVLRMEAGE